MPQVTLELVSLDNKPLVGITHRFDGDGGTIGRDEGNALALADAYRRVSRLHAAISFPDGVPTITNSSSALHLGVGGMQLKCGQTTALAAGMSLDIGPYVLVVQSCSEPDRMVSDPVAALVGVPPPPVSGKTTTPFPNIGGLSVSGDPFADLLEGLGPALRQTGTSMSDASAQVADDPLARLFSSSSPPSLTPVSDGSGGVPDPFAALNLTPDRGTDPRRKLPTYSPPDTSRPVAVVIPEDFNPFELPSAAARNSADPLASMLGAPATPSSHGLTIGEPSIDALFAPGGASLDDILAHGASSSGASLAESSGRHGSLLKEVDNSDPLSLFGDLSPGVGSSMQPVRDDQAEIKGAFQPPRMLDTASQLAVPAKPRAITAGPPPPAHQPVATPSYPEDALTRAFLVGANLPPSALPQGLTPEIMTVVGRLLYSATAGAIDMLAIRANIKREVQANVTIISSQANNPLKFLPDADSVLHQLLGKKLPGFMRPDEAMNDAFNDLRAHELGVMAGTRAALSEVLARFDPAILSERLTGGSLLEKALPAMRKTKLWDLYLARYAHIRREAEDDFQSIFGKAFVEAYEGESARMKAPPSQRESR